MTDLTHTLISISATPVTFHAYLICDKDEAKDQIEHAANLMVEKAEELGANGLLPIVLVTTNLNDDARAVVRGIVEQDPEATELLATVTDYHMSVFSVPSGSADNARLMALH
jgi:G3E family GTPase